MMELAEEDVSLELYIFIGRNMNYKQLKEHFFIARLTQCCIINLSNHASCFAEINKAASEKCPVSKTGKGLSTSNH